MVSIFGEVGMSDSGFAIEGFVDITIRAIDFTDDEGLLGVEVILSQG